MQGSDVVIAFLSEHFFDLMTHLGIHIFIQGANLSAGEEVHLRGIVVKPQPPVIGFTALKVECTKDHDDLSTYILVAWADLEIAILAWA